MALRPDSISHFRILKGGKISLVVSALLVGSSLIGTSAYAIPCNSSYTIDSNTSNQSISMCTNTNVTVNGTLNVTDYYLALGVSGAHALTLTNNGTISNDNATGATGIYLSNVTGLNFTNNGDVNATASGVLRNATGIQLYNSASTDLNDSQIINGGTITVIATQNAHGIEFDWDYSVNDSTIINDGHITVQGGNFSSGISLPTRYFDGSSSIVNNGVINVNSTSNEARGISVEYFHDTASIVNSGTIITTGDRAKGIYAYELYDSSSVTNSGTISATANHRAHGIYTDSLHDNSTITNSGFIQVTGSEAYGIRLDNPMHTNSRITNEEMGVITVISTNGEASGIKVDSALELNATIENKGTINVAAEESGYAYGISAGYMYYYDGSYHYVGMSDDSNITNSGSINVNANSDAVGIYVIGEDSASVTNSGTIIAKINGNPDAKASSIVSIGVNVNNTETGRLYGNIHVSNSINFDPTLTNQGLISLPYNATGEDTAFISNFLQTSTGVLEIGLQTDGTTTTHSQLNTNTAVFANGSTIKVNVLTASTNQELLVGKQLENVVTASTSLTIDGPLQITDNSPLLDFEYTTSAYGEDTNVTWGGNGTAGAIHLNIIEGLSIFETSKLGGANSNTLGAASALDGASSQLAGFFGALVGLGDDYEAIADAVQSTTPVSGVSTTGAITQIMNGIQGIVEQRQGANIGGGLNSGEDLFGEKSFWFKPYGSWGKQDNKGGINGFDLSAKGVGIGFDGSYAKDSKAGIAFFYTDADVDVNNITQKSELKAYTALFYGSIPVVDERTKFLYQVGYSWQNVDISTDLQKGDYTSKTVSLDAKVMRDYKINDELTLQPLVEATYRDFRSPSYEQSGALITTLVDSFNAQELIVGVGALAHYKLDDVSKIIANVNLGYDLIDDGNSITSAYSVAPTVKFTTNGIDNGRWVYEAGIGYERKISKESSINIMYNYEAQGSYYDNHAISARFEYKF